jgi:hypothetical protein
LISCHHGGIGRCVTNVTAGAYQPEKEDSLSGKGISIYNFMTAYCLARASDIGDTISSLVAALYPNGPSAGCTIFAILFRLFPWGAELRGPEGNHSRYYAGLSNLDQDFFFICCRRKALGSCTGFHPFTLTSRKRLSRARADRNVFGEHTSSAVLPKPEYF